MQAAESLLREILDTLPQVKAAREDRALCGITDDLTGVAALTIVTGAGMVHNLRAGETVYMSQFMYELSSNSDSARFEIGWTTGADGIGTFHPITPIIRVATGGTVYGGRQLYVPFDPPRKVTYIEGARSITVRVQANDAAARLMVAWCGWSEFYVAHN